MPVGSLIGAAVVNGMVVVQRPDGNPPGLSFAYSGRVENPPAPSAALQTQDARYRRMDDSDVGPTALNSSDYAAATGSDTVITLPAAGPGRNHVLSGLAFGYRTTPSGGYVSIQNGSGNVAFRVPVTSAGAGFIPFDPPRRGDENTDMILTLGNGGPGVVGELSIISRRID
jgi:hypothetical protein